MAARSTKHRVERMPVPYCGELSCKSVVLAVGASEGFKPDADCARVSLVTRIYPTF